MKIRKELKYMAMGKPKKTQDAAKHMTQERKVDGSANFDKNSKVEELEERLARLLAEFDNYRKRTEKEKRMHQDLGEKHVIENLLPIVDNFERGFETIEEDNNDAFVVGMRMVYKQLMSMLESMEVKPIESIGKEFDPDFHNAVAYVDDEVVVAMHGVGSNIIVEEYKKGYMYKDSVIRYSMVKVAK